MSEHIFFFFSLAGSRPLAPSLSRARARSLALPQREGKKQSSRKKGGTHQVTTAPNSIDRLTACGQIIPTPRYVSWKSKFHFQARALRPKEGNRSKPPEQPAPASEEKNHLNADQQAEAPPHLPRAATCALAVASPPREWSELMRTPPVFMGFGGGGGMFFCRVKKYLSFFRLFFFSRPPQLFTSRLPFSRSPSLRETGTKLKTRNSPAVPDGYGKS